MIEEDDLLEGKTLPKYSTLGRIFVHVIGPCSAGVYQYEYDVLDYDSDTSVFWINEGEGFDYWLDTHCIFPNIGMFIIEGINGCYIRGNWSYGEDDDVIWEYDKIRQASAYEIKSGRL